MPEIQIIPTQKPPKEKLNLEEVNEVSDIKENCETNVVCCV